MAEIVPPNAPLSVREHVAPPPPADRRRRPHLVSHVLARIQKKIVIALFANAAPAAPRSR
jgi:hypothetical protein